MSHQLLIPKFGAHVNLSEFDPAYSGNYDKKKAREEEKHYETRMGELQEMLYAQGKQGLLIVLQAMDAGGKDGTIKHVFDSINPQGVRITSFKAPTAEELSHDFLWRIHQHVPPKGYIGIFNRSHYEDVLIVRVNNLVPADVWKKRYDHINHFERLLSESGIRILKFFLHISRDEQKKRFEERLSRPDKHWKFSSGDLPVREQWDTYMEAYEAVLTKCNTEYAPWHIVPGNRKWYRDFIISKTIVETLEDMKLAYPDPEPGLDKIVIPD
ncbi:MAG: polyphosphate kinase 2 family protein [Anaerolineae bacterium]|nr:polyphosphate kinase 2 family protein [Anaerolineae bacterium]